MRGEKPGAPQRGINTPEPSGHEGSPRVLSGAVLAGWLGQSSGGPGTMEGGACRGRFQLSQAICRVELRLDRIRPVFVLSYGRERCRKAATRPHPSLAAALSDSAVPPKSNGGGDVKNSRKRKAWPAPL